MTAQMTFDGEVVFGNEWIDYEKTYYKITLNEDGVYRIYGSELADNGVNLNSLQGSELQLIHWGKQVPIYISSDGNITTNDFIEFVGSKNTGELDKQIYPEWEENQLNLKYSNFTDESAYFLTWEPNSNDNPRISDQPHVVDANIPVESHYIHKEEVIFDRIFSKPSYTENVRYSNFDIAEGFGSGYARTREINFDVTNLVETSNSQPSLHVRTGTNSTTHSLSISYSDKEIHTETFSGYKVIDFETTLLNSDLLGSNTLLVHGNIDNNDRYTVAHSTLHYPRALEFENASYVAFQTRENSSAFNFDFARFNNSTDNLIVIDASANKRYTIQDGNDRIQFLLESGNNRRDLHMLNDGDGYKRVLKVEERRFTDYSQENPNYLMLTSNRLNTTQNNNSVQQYADYRSSELGGSYSAYTINVEELYDQFAFGVIRNPLSVRNFIYYIDPFWTELEFMFIVGKGVEYASYRTEEQIADPETPTYYVPTWGFPGSDNLLLAEKGLSAPLVPVGRIAARNSTDIDNYLNKVMNHDLIYTTNQTLEDKSWTKEIIHLSGGDPNIQENLYQHLLQMEDIIESSVFGADVTTFRKSSADPLQSATSSDILGKINEGKAIITFFGHSGVGTFDFSLEDVAEWKNENKLPMIISLGCHSGNIHGTSNTLGLSESFILEPEKGAILFLASSSSAFISPQAVAGKSYYTLFGNDNYNKPVGRSIQDFLENNNTVQSLSMKSLNQQLTFHGDPAIKFYSHPTPDYIVDNSSIQLQEDIVTITDEEFSIEYDILNLGRASSDSIDIKVAHYLPDNTLYKEYKTRIGNIRYKNSVRLVLENPGLIAAGKNRIDIILDDNSEVLELPDPEAETNNTLSNLNDGVGYSFFISSNLVRPKYPNEFSIINTADLTYIATGNNAFNEVTDYIIQLDTSDLFITPLLSEKLTQANGTIEWSPTFEYSDETVYYWRISPELESGDPLWQSSSFLYLPNESEGWNQSHYYQFLNDDLSQARFENRRLEFPFEYEETTLNLFVPDGTLVRPRYKRDATSLGAARLWEIPSTGICVLLRDPLQLSFPVNDVPGLHGSWSKNSTRRIFFFQTEEETSRIDLVNFLEDQVENGYHVFLNTIHNNLDGDLFTGEWALDSLSNNGKNIFNVLESYGAQSIRKIEKENVHYGFFFTKGGQVHDEAYSNSIQEEINLSAVLPRNKTEGTINSVLIGPSSAWGTLDTRIEGIEENDSISLNIFGIDNDNNEILLYENISTGLFDLSETPSSLYPHLKLSYSATDTENRTFPSLEYWRINYKEIPEVIYNTEELLSFNKEDLFIGDNIIFDASVKNISTVDMDSLLVKYSIIDGNNNTIDSYVRNEELNANSAYSISYNRSTVDMDHGEYQFIAELNPDEDQIERQHYDNFFVYPFTIFGDQINPILDVTFDNKYILNGEKVSSSPSIVITLVDPDATLILDEITDFQIALFDADNVKIPIDILTDSRIEFVPGSSSNNIASLIFTPTLDAGEYSFFAQAKDRSGNFSGNLEYNVDFIVTSANNEISAVSIFPNPSNGGVINLVLNINGNKIPSSLDIHFYNMLGQKVFTLMTQESGYNLTVGSNIIPISLENTSSQLIPGMYGFSLSLPESEKVNFSEDYSKDAKGKFIILK